MLNRLNIALFLFIGLNAAAQDNKNVPQPVSQAETVTVDYRQIGTPMPPLVIATYHDSTKTGNEPLSKKDKKRLIKDPMANQQVKLITNNDLKNNGSLLVMIFNPTCEHCEATTDMLEKNIGVFDSTQIILIATSTQKEYLPLFTKKHNVDAYKNIFAGTDSSGFINNTFLYQPLPQINIYNAERNLTKIFTGEVSIDSLKPYVR